MTAVVRDNGATLFCTACGVKVGLCLPMPLSEYAAVMNDFAKRHKQCEPGDPVLTGAVKAA